jgi:hypothetical protein
MTPAVALAVIFAGAGLIVGISRYLKWAVEEIKKNSVSDPVGVGAPLEPHSSPHEIHGLRVLLQHDPSFDPERFLSRATVAYSKISDCAARRDFAVVGTFMSDGQAEARRIGLMLEDIDGVRWDTDNIELAAPQIRWVESDRLFDAIYVAFRGRCRKRRLEAATDRVVSESPMGDFAEIWTFVRRPGRESHQRPGLIEGCCPNCGAPVQMADAGRCASCKSWINSGEYDWVLTNTARTVDPDGWLPSEDWRRHRGLALLGQADPEANLHFLIDRAQIAFWRWRLANAQGDPGALRAVASETFFVKAGPSLVKSRPAAVRLDEVRFEAFETESGFDRVNFWARCGYDGTTQLTLVRKVGAQTSARAGLCSIRCVNCGAPPTRWDLAACEYCNTPFNDGSQHWVLDAVERLGA